MVGECRDLHQQILSSYDQNSTSKLKYEVNLLQEDISTRSDNTRKALKAISADVKRLQCSQTGSTHARVLQQQHSALLQRFMDCMTQYNEVQETSRDQYRNFVRKQYQIVKPNASEAEIQQALSANGGSIFANEVVSAQHQQAKKALEDIKDRHQELLALEKNIRELAMLFQDMAMLIAGQGQALDRIDNNVENAADYVNDAKVELHEGVKLQSAARKKKIIFFALIILAVIIVAAFL
eukprot:Pgem_evm1s6716